MTRLEEHEECKKISKELLEWVKERCGPDKDWKDHLDILFVSFMSTCLINYVREDQVHAKIKEGYALLDLVGLKILLSMLGNAEQASENEITKFVEALLRK